MVDILVSIVDIGNVWIVKSRIVYKRDHMYHN